jgi:hypothetical protein
VKLDIFVQLKDHQIDTNARTEVLECQVLALTITVSHVLKDTTVTEFQRLHALIIQPTLMEVL